MVCGILNSPPKNIKAIFFQFVYITDPSGIYLGTKIEIEFHGLPNSSQNCFPTGLKFYFYHIEFPYVLRVCFRFSILFYHGYAKLYANSKLAELWYLFNTFYQ